MEQRRAALLELLCLRTSAIRGVVASTRLRSILVTAIVGLISPSAAPANPPTTSSFPLQLEVRAPLSPTAFASGEHVYLTYELYLTNFSATSLDVHRIEVLDADGGPATRVAQFDGEALDSLLQPIGVQSTASHSNPQRLPPGGTTVVFMWLSFDRSGAPVPKKLSHAVFTADSASMGAVVGTHELTLQVLAPPLKGANWLAEDGPSNDQDNHHRRGLLVLDGRPGIDRRFAIDWTQMRDGSAFEGDPAERSSYYSYGKEVLAVADGVVIQAKSDRPDNVPRHNGQFHPAVPITIDVVPGNSITLDLGGGQFAHYFHLQSGSVKFKAGDRVRRGQILGQVGCSGDARAPHLHFEVTNSPKPLAGEGVPYLIERYSVKRSVNERETRTREMPLRGMLVDFD